MSLHGYTRQQTVLDSTSANSSTRTSNAFLVADAAGISVSWVTAVAVASNLTIQASNDDGLSFAGPNMNTGGIWSNVSVVAGAGIFTITPGARWLRFIRPAVDSQASIAMNYRVE